MKQNIKYIIFIVGLAVLIILFMDFTSRITEVGRLKHKKEQVIEQVTQLAATAVYLQTKVSYVKSDVMVLAYAYRDRRMLREGDVRVVPLADVYATPNITPTAYVPRTHYPNWEYWQALFIEPDS